MEILLYLFKEVHCGPFLVYLDVQESIPVFWLNLSVIDIVPMQILSTWLQNQSPEDSRL